VKDGRYPPISDYGLLGDLRSAALLSKHGSVDWMCLPRFDSPAIFSRILDWDRGGFFQVCPHGESLSYRRYRSDSNVIETIWSTDHQRLRVVDWMPITVKGKKPQPPESLRLVRMLQPMNGTTEWEAVFKPRWDYGRQDPNLRLVRKSMVEARFGDERFFLQYPAGAQCELRDTTAYIRGRALPGRRAHLLFHYAGKGGVPAEIPIEAAHAFLHQTDDYWVNWLRSTTYRGQFDEALHRSALALQLMRYLPTGAFVAAPTASLPESPGGSLNWDYRYTWVRDTADLVNALSELGYVDEADRFLVWLRSTHERHPKEFRIMYRVDGDDQIPEYVLDELEGYRGSRPVRIGNAAAEQLQLDVYGEVLQTVYVAWRLSKKFPGPRRKVALGIIDLILEHWDEQDSGIWEARDRLRKYTYSRVMMWCGLDRSLRMDSVLRMGSKRKAAVKRTRDAIRRQVLEEGYDKELGSFTQSIGYKDLDAAVLAVAMYEMLPANDPRIVSTVKVLQDKLSDEGFLFRYRGAESEFHEREGVFVICTLWLVNVLCQMGRKDEAAELFSRVTEAANDLGLYSEEYDPKSGEMMGNFPQALTHLGVINAILNLEGLPSGKGVRSGIRRRKPG
jgi:GH15 family glucan-1,4-alpha-glucosidase